MDNIKIFENIIRKNRGWVSQWPQKAVFICSGGMDSTTTMAKLLKEKKVELFPLFINRGQSNVEYERGALKYFEKYFKKKYGKLFHNVMEIAINVPAKEIKDKLRQYSKKFGYPLRNTILQMVGVQYAISISEETNQKISSVLCAQIDDDPFPHSKLVSLRATTLDVCQSLGEWNWQITSPNIDPFLSRQKFMKKDMIRWAFNNKFPLEKTRSCYSNMETHCGTCLTCRRRKKAFIDAGLPDLTEYREEIIK